MPIYPEHQHHIDVNTAVHTSHRPKVSYISWKLALLMGLLISLILATAAYSIWASHEKIFRHINLADASAQIDVQAYATHLWFEEALSGDRYVDMDMVMHHLDRCMWFAQAMLHGGGTQNGRIVPLRDPSLQEAIRHLIAKQQAFKDILFQRWEMRSVYHSGIGSEIDQIFDAKFLSLIRQADAVEARLQAMVHKDLHTFRMIQYIMLGTILLVSAATVIAFNRFLRDRQFSQAAAQEQKEELSITLDSIGDGVISTDVNGGVVRMNPIAQHLTGWSETEARGKTLDDVFVICNANTGDRLESPVGTVLREGKIVGLANHTQLIARDGTAYHIADSAAPIQDQGGQVRGVVLVFQDVSLKYEQEEKIRRSETALRDLFENAPIGIFRTNSKGQVLHTNPAMSKMLKLESSEQREAYTNDLARNLYVHPKRRRELLHLLKNGGQVEQFEFEGKCLDGTRAWFSMHARVSQRPPEGPFIIDGFVSEITQRKRAEKNVEHLNRVLRAMRNINHLILEEKNRARLIQTACRSLVQSRGFDAAMIILTDNSQTPFMHAQEGLTESAFAELGRLLDQGDLPRCCEEAMHSNSVCLINKPSGTCRGCPLSRECQQCDTLCAELRHMDAGYGFIAVAVPLGQGRAPGEQALLNELAADLAFALHGIEREERTQQMEEEKKEAEKQLAQAQKMEAIGRLAGGVAHDFNNMLGVILGYTDIALARMDGHNPLHHPLEQIQQAAERSADLTRQLLAFSRKQLTQPKVMDLNQEIENQRTMLARLIGENIELKFSAGHDLWPIQIDPSQIDQILANLVINARDAIPEVGTITLETANVTMDTAYTHAHLYATPGDYVCLMVSDTGRGMDDQIMEKIFDPFFTAKQGGEGTGLGLSTVYGIVKQNNGLIHVYSEPEEGTTFKLYFPRCDEQPAEREEHRREVPLQGRETVLLVEDEELVLELTQTVLDEQGYTVLTARTPGQAQELAEEHKGGIDLLLTDVIMPEMNGKELKASIEAITPGIKTLFMSGYTENVVVQRGIVDPKFFFIQKPFSAVNLAKKIREVLAS